MKYIVAAVVGIWVFFVGAMICSAVNAQEATPTVPMIEGTIAFMFEDGTIESIKSDSLFMTQRECYEKGRAAVQGFLPQLPTAIGHLITCQPAGKDI